ncbi:hypothetical protein J21TS3_32900 [Paenibacillus cookii]|uniref:Uncharacterized protein n=1 Tax=Paenibacillus cookii TaxID=157839 RepID=A0ABQ4LYW5_9BACL|nr:hypothetical protein J21TS3_32900 [Paenibacillus cookii]
MGKTPFSGQRKKLQDTSWLRYSTGVSLFMIVLLVMLDRGLDEWFKPILPEEAAPFFCEYLTDKEYRKLTPPTHP